MAAPHHVHLSVFPLGSSEPARVQAAIRTAWASPSWVASREVHGAWFFQAVTEAVLPEGLNEAAFAERLSIAIWRALGRYVRVAVDTSATESDTSCHHELGRTSYLRLMRTAQGTPE
ncbi:hypothetical protein [Chitinimonas sp.]|uniref:hypothetical protein n=1 Tax=Chitinimonas sp. TaxID=1934313 RepID=UPI002F93DC6F